MIHSTDSPIATIRDPRHGSQAEVHTGFGFNCFRWQVPVEEAMHEVLWAAPGFEDGSQRASGSGIPILFPFPGRIRQGKFSFEGKDFSLPTGDGKGNAIHGFVLDRPWRVTEQLEAKIHAEFQASQDAPEILGLWPADFRLAATYEIAGDQLHTQFAVDNPGEDRLPFGLGLHPYFRLPGAHFVRDVNPRVQVPVESYWELDELLPTGRVLPASERGKLAQGVPFSKTQFDDVFTGLASTDGEVRATVREPGSGLGIEIRFAEAFRECVVYNPPHREAICIEPYTCVPDAFHLREQRHETGLRVLEPGESWSAHVTLRFGNLSE